MRLARTALKYQHCLSIQDLELQKLTVMANAALYKSSLHKPFESTRSGKVLNLQLPCGLSSSNIIARATRQLREARSITVAASRGRSQYDCGIPVVITPSGRGSWIRSKHADVHEKDGVKSSVQRKLHRRSLHSMCSCYQHLLFGTNMLPQSLRHELWIGDSRASKVA